MKTNETDHKKKLEDLEDGDAFTPFSTQVGTGRTIKYWNSRTDLNDKEVRILCILLSHAGMDGCFPGQEVIAESAHLKVVWTSKLLKRLKAKGYIDYIPSRGSGIKTHYTFLFRKSYVNIKPLFYTRGFIEKVNPLKPLCYTRGFIEENPYSRAGKPLVLNNKTPILELENPYAIPGAKDLKDPKEEKERAESHLSPPLDPKDIVSSCVNQNQKIDYLITKFLAIVNPTRATLGMLPLVLENEVSNFKFLLNRIDSTRIEKVITWFSTNTHWLREISNGKTFCSKFDTMEGQMMNPRISKTDYKKVSKSSEQEHNIHNLDDPDYGSWLIGIDGKEMKREIREEDQEYEDISEE